MSAAVGTAAVLGPCSADGDPEEFARRARAVLGVCAEVVGWPMRATAVGAGDGFERERRRQLDRLLHEHGWAGLSWPRDCGGAGLTTREHALFAREAARLGLATPFNRIGLGIVGPALLQFGTAEQKQRFLRPILSCDQIWCQGFSEPEAGSDLAALRTLAAPDGDRWRVTGHKIWTTLGADADFCFLLARTSEGAGHRGISALLVPMRQPGVEVRPIRQLNGEQDFSEVFFDGALVPRDNVLGSVGDGWRVTMTALSYERSFHMLARQLRLEQLVTGLIADVDWAEADDASADAVIDVSIAAYALRFAMAEQLEAVDDGGDLGVAANASKVLWSESYQRLCQIGVDLAGRQPGRVPTAWIQEQYASLATSIYAGTNEVQRNIIAERGLGLPR